MITFIIVLISLSILILGHEAGHFFAAKKAGMRVDEFGIGFPPRIKAWKRGETEYSINWLPFGGFVKIAGENAAPGEEAPESEEEKKRFFSFRPAWQRAIVLFAGVAINFLIGWALLSVIFMMGTPKMLIIESVAPDSPAAVAGIKAGDIVSEHDTAEGFISFISENLGEEVELTVIRSEGQVSVSAIPREDPPEGEGALGVALAEGGAPSLGFFQAIGEGFKFSVQIGVLTVRAFYDLAKNLLVSQELLEGVVGPVGIFSLAITTSQFGVVFLLQLIGVISINLAVANMIPFPALDGGRLLLLLVEKIKGSPVPHKTEAILNGIGFLILIALMVLVTVRDVIRL